MRELIYLSKAKLAAFQPRRRRFEFTGNGDLEVSFLGLRIKVAANPSGNGTDPVISALRTVERALARTALDIQDPDLKSGKWFRFKTPAVWTGRSPDSPWNLLPQNLVLFGLALENETTVVMCGSSQHLFASRPDMGPRPDVEPPTRTEFPVHSSSVPVSGYDWVDSTARKLLLPAKFDSNSPLSAKNPSTIDIEEYEALITRRERAVIGDRDTPTELTPTMQSRSWTRTNNNTILYTTFTLGNYLRGLFAKGIAPEIAGYARVLAVGPGPSSARVILATPLVVEYVHPFNTGRPRWQRTPPK